MSIPKETKNFQRLSDRYYVFRSVFEIETQIAREEVNSFFSPFFLQILRGLCVDINLSTWYDIVAEKRICLAISKTILDQIIQHVALAEVLHNHPKDQTPTKEQEQLIILQMTVMFFKKIKANPSLSVCSTLQDATNQQEFTREQMAQLKKRGSRMYANTILQKENIEGHWVRFLPTSLVHFYLSSQHTEKKIEYRFSALMFQEYKNKFESFPQTVIPLKHAIGILLKVVVPVIMIADKNNIQVFSDSHAQSKRHNIIYQRVLCLILVTMLSIVEEEPSS
ncbi:MAG: hypothetical protein ACTSUE_07580 [Promethearchaeota archaeon]